MTSAGRWAIYVHDPDGDMGYGRIVGPFRDVVTADRKADAIRRAAGTDSDDLGRIECIVLPLEAGATAARDIAAQVIDAS